MHMVEQLMRGGHFGAFCTFLAEVAHKDFIKMAAALSRTDASYNVSQDNMLKWVLWQAIFNAVFERTSEPMDTEDPPRHTSSQDGGSDTDDDVLVQWKELCHLSYLDRWSGVGDICMEAFLSNRVRVTAKGLLNLMCRKLGMRVSQISRAKLLSSQLQWRCFGALCEKRRNLKRKFVGISSLSKDRRDFVHIRTPAETVADDGTITAIDTCWAAQILMFLHVSGFTTPDLGVFLPTNCRNSEANAASVRFALVRWLAPHPDALLRDDIRRPICSSPFDINHALWTFAKEDHNIISAAVVNRNIMNYEGDDMGERVANSRRERRAMYGLVDPGSFEQFMNCTRINTDVDDDTILETITLPF